MSKTYHSIYRFAFVLALILQIFTFARAAEAVETRIKITNSDVFVEGNLKDAKNAPNVTNFSFVKSYAGVDNLAARFADVVLLDKDGQTVGFKKLADGEFLAEKPFSAWRYRVDLRVPKSVSALAHVSWIAGEQGILMLGDLLPETAETTAARVMFDLPANWKISSVEKRAETNVFEVFDVEKAVFYIGKNWRESSTNAGSARINLIMSGEWQIADADASEMSREILAFYEKLFGARSFETAQIFLGRFPPDVKTGRWEAETRGASVTIFSSEMDFKTQSLQRLHEQLRHEIFHLWFPNGVNLSGNYDWFYEGFALYQSLRTALAAKRIRFEDFLDTLARAQTIDSFISQKRSLIEASKNRWNGANTQVYARGMVVAFLIDVTLLQKSKGKTELADVLREIYQKHAGSSKREDGNTAILDIFGTHKELQGIVENYIKKAENIEWQTDLAAIGIESATDDFSTKLKVKDGLSGRQKDLLEKLGYNNWRK